MVRSMFQRLVGTREPEKDYESLLLDRNSLSVISEDEGNGEASYGSLLTLHSHQSRKEITIRWCCKPTFLATQLIRFLFLATELAGSGYSLTAQGLPGSRT